MAGVMAGAEHRAHAFTRVISTSSDGRGVFGCTYPRCGETEVRRVDERSPFAIKREQAAQRAAARARRS